MNINWDNVLTVTLCVMSALIGYLNGFLEASG